MEQQEKISIQIASLLLSLEDEQAICHVAHEAKDMAIRARRGWWEIPGRPAFNKLMMRLRRQPKGEPDHGKYDKESRR